MSSLFQEKKNCMPRNLFSSVLKITSHYIFFFLSAAAIQRISQEFLPSTTNTKNQLDSADKESVMTEPRHPSSLIFSQETKTFQ